jgi:hypothetical protein
LFRYGTLYIGKKNSSAENHQNYATGCTHANGIWGSLGLSLYLHTFGYLRGTRFVVIKFVRFDPYTDNFVSLNIHPFCDWGI